MRIACGAAVDRGPRAFRWRGGGMPSGKSGRDPAFVTRSQVSFAAWKAAGTPRAVPRLANKRGGS